MKSIEEQLRGLLTGWENIALEQFRRNAEREMNGTLFESIRSEAGPRIFLVVCATGAHEMAKIERTFDLDFDPEPAWSWESQTLFDLAFNTERGTGLSYQDNRATSGKPTALILCATRPQKVKMLEIAFGLD